MLMTASTNTDPGGPRGEGDGERAVGRREGVRSEGDGDRQGVKGTRPGQGQVRGEASRPRLSDGPLWCPVESVRSGSSLPFTGLWENKRCKTIQRGWRKMKMGSVWWPRGQLWADCPVGLACNDNTPTRIPVQQARNLW